MTTGKWETCDKQVNSGSEERSSESGKESKMPQWNTLAVLLDGDHGYDDGFPVNVNPPTWPILSKLNLPSKPAR